MTLTVERTARLCPRCGHGDIVPHCGTRTCPWEKCDLCDHATKRTTVSDILEAT